jgi:hypothetical protein
MIAPDLKKYRLNMKDICRRRRFKSSTSKLLAPIPSNGLRSTTAGQPLPLPTGPDN